ncbi:hypothetical protein AHAS_Ahas16G0196600 [Arachis hypogaea]
MRTLKEQVRSNMQNQGAAIKKLEEQVGYLSKQIPMTIHNSPSVTMVNPREECNAITLRSGKEVKEAPRETQNKEVDKGISDKEEEALPPTHPNKKKS